LADKLKKSSAWRSISHGPGRVKGRKKTRDMTHIGCSGKEN